jgi:sec-independent protein translocase protein TatA
MGLTPLHLLMVLVVVFLLFGNRLPSAMRSLGRGVTEFKKGLEGGPEEGDEEETDKPKKKKKKPAAEIEDDEDDDEVLEKPKKKPVAEAEGNGSAKKDEKTETEKKDA